MLQHPSHMLLGMLCPPPLVLLRWEVMGAIFFFFFLKIIMGHFDWRITLKRTETWEAPQFYSILQ